MEDEIAHSILHTIGRAFYFIVRVLVWGILEYFFHEVCWYIGWPIVRALSLGRLPKQGILAPHRAHSVTGLLVCLVGFISLVAVGAGLARFLGSGV